MTKFTFTQRGGELAGNYATTTLVNNTTATRTITVGSDIFYYLYGGYLLNADNVARVLVVEIQDPSNNPIIQLFNHQIGANADTGYPAVCDGTANKNGVLWMYPIPLQASWKIVITWTAGGASAGGTAKSTALIQQLKGV